MTVSTINKSKEFQIEKTNMLINQDIHLQNIIMTPLTTN